MMLLNLNGLWQLSPLTDLTVLQDDITFPAPLSQVLPPTMTETQIQQQEWHLMHDVELDETMLQFPAAVLRLGGIGFYAQVRVNGFAVFDCDQSQLWYQKEVRPYLQLGRNRIEVLFLEQDDDFLVDDTSQQNHIAHCLQAQVSEPAMGIWQVPQLQFVPHVELKMVTTEQIWHHGGGCELKVMLHYKTHRAGLVSALIKFNGMSYRYPIDVRSDHISALFQVDAPKKSDLFAGESHVLPANNDADSCPSIEDISVYWLEVELDEQVQRLPICLTPQLCVGDVL